MKKLFGSIMTAVTALCMTVTAMAATSSVSVKNNTVTAEPVSYEYETGSNDEIVTSIKSLMENLDELEKEESVVQTITVSSESADKSPVTFKLRLSIAEDEENPQSTPTPTEYSSLDYYDIVVTDTTGAVLYSYEEEHETEDGAKYKDITLATLNTVKADESKVFNITVSINEELDRSSVAKCAKNLDWSIVSTTSTELAQTTDETTDTEETTHNENVKEDKYGVVTVQAGEYVCGDDFDEGRYTATGSGKLTVYTKDGNVKTTVALKNNDDSESKGVTEYVVNLEDGEKIAVDAETKLTPYIASKATTEPKATTNPSQSTAAKKSSSNTNGKNNPKTGDTAPVAFLATVGAMAMGIVAYIEIKKRKQN